MKLSATTHSGNDDVESSARKKSRLGRRGCVADLLDYSDESEDENIDDEDDDVIDDNVLDAKSSLLRFYRYKAVLRYRDGLLTPERTPDVSHDSASSLVHRLAEREVQADEAELDSQVNFGSPGRCRLTGNAGPPTITYALHKRRPAAVAAMSADDFFKKKRHLNTANPLLSLRGRR